MSDGNQLFPVFLKLAGRPCLVVGGGELGLRKARSLLEAGARVTVVSPRAEPELEALAREGRIRWERRVYRRGDLAGSFLAFVAIGDREAARDVYLEAEERGIPVNSVDDDPHCTFHVPAVAVRGDLKVAVSTAGKSPALAAELRDRIGAALDGDLIRYVAALGALRERVLERWSSDPAARGRVLAALGRSIRPGAGRPTEGKGRGESSAASEESAAGATPLDRGKGIERGKVYIVGAGPGDPGLLTLRAKALLESADEVHHDRLVGPGVLDLIPATTRRVFVGKELGDSSRPDTGELLVRAAREGKAVVRLKGGDPNVFGRGGEEVLALLRADVPFEVVPGVSALTAVPAAAGIPITFRGLAREVVVRSGYQRPDPVDPALPSDRNETTYVYFMTMGRLEEIVGELLAEGVSPSTPAAIIERGTLPGQRVVVSVLAELPARAAEEVLRPPALVVVGEVVRLARWRENAALLESLLVGESPPGE